MEPTRPGVEIPAMRRFNLSMRPPTWNPIIERFFGKLVNTILTGITNVLTLYFC